MAEPLVPNPTALLAALAWRLREGGVRAGPAELDQAMALLSSRERWSRTDLLSVLPLVFGKTPDQQAVVRAAVETLLAAPARPPSKNQSDSFEKPKQIQVEGPPQHIIVPPSLWERIKHGLAAMARRMSTPRMLVLLAIFLAAAGFLVAAEGGFGTTVELLARGAQDAIGDPFGYELDPFTRNYDDALLLRHSLASAFFSACTLAAVGAIRAIWLRLSSSGTGEWPRPRVPVRQGDGSVFRVGSLGGKPPPFLTATQARSAAELMAYRRTSQDRRMLDLPDTLDRQARGNWDPLSFERRRELPSVLILRDMSSSARHWNTLPSEFEEAMARHGLNVESISFVGSFFSRHGSSQGTSTADDIEAAIGDSGWTVAAVFADLGALSGSDVDFLAGLAEIGPVLGLDFKDRWLWDRRHHQLEKRGIILHPATGAGLVEAIGDAFVPRRAIGSDRRSAGHAVAGHSLPSGFAEWAAACATIQPVSFPLAERLRQCHTAMASDENALAFSMLAATEGAWVGPEGLRFSPPVRRRLLQRMAELPRAMQVPFLEVLDRAFGEEPEGETAAELWRYTRARAEMFSLRQWRAEQDLVDIRAKGLVATQELSGFISRLGGPEAPDGGDVIRLRMSPRAALADPDMRKDARQSRAEQGQTVLADWSVGLADARVRLAPGPPTSLGPLAGFLSGGSSILLCEPAAEDEADILSEIDASRGVRRRLVFGMSGRRAEIDIRGAVQMVTFARGRSGALSMANGRLFLFSVSDASELPERGRRATFEEVEGVERGAPTPLLALSPTGDQIAYAIPGDTTIRLGSMDSSRSHAALSVDGQVTVLAFAQPELLLIGCAGGQVWRVVVSKGDLRLRDERVRVLADEVAALASVDAPGSLPFTVAALADGTITAVEQPSLLAGGFGVHWRPRALVPFPERSAALVRGAAQGISLAVLGAGSEFEILGMPTEQAAEPFNAGPLTRGALEPSRDGLGVLAINRATRRVAVLNGDNLEIRPLLYDLPDPLPTAMMQPDAKSTTSADTFNGAAA